MPRLITHLSSTDIVADWMRNVPDRLRYLNVCFPVYGAVWEDVGNSAWLEEVCHQEWALGFHNLAPLLASCLCFMFAVDGVSSQLFFFINYKPK